MPRRSRVATVLLVVLLVFATVGIGATALDRLGYCPSELLPGEAAIDAPPYVQNVTQTSAAILWQTKRTTSGTVDYGETPVLGTTIAVGPGRIHTVRLTGLRPATRYHYRVTTDGDVTTASFRTAPGPEAIVTIGVLGDSGTGSEAQYHVAALLERMAPDVILHTGDVVYRRGALCHYGPKFFEPYRELLPSTPFYPSFGNHDAMAAGGTAYFETFDLPANNPEESERYYSFDYGPVHVAVIDSELYHAGDPEAVARQKEWLAADLAATTLPWTIVVFHRPPFSSASHAYKADDRIRDDLTPLFAALEVDLVLSGHAHNYERFHPIDGVTYVVTGGGGARLHPIRPGPATAAAASVHHALKLVVSPDQLVLEAIDVDGAVLDRLDLRRS